MKFYDTVILGGGASGMMCALRLAERVCKKILILERNDRLGKKLSATGNGHGTRKITKDHRGVRRTRAARVSRPSGRFIFCG